MIQRLLLSIICLFTVSSYAATRTAVKTGNWEAGDTWTGNVAPDCGDSIIIPQTYTVTITSVLDYNGCASTLKIAVHGHLTFQNGKKLKLPCGSRIYIYSGGSISSGGGGGSSNLIDICSTTVWQTSNGTLTGTNCLPPDPTCSSFTLPVEFNGFSASNVGKKIKLQWFTASEKDNDFFTVERAGTDGMFSPLGKVPGAGNSHIMREYIFDDVSPLTGTGFYRIKQTDINGSTSYSGIVAIRKQKEVTMNIYPNPSQGILHIESGGVFEKEEVTISVSDYTGRIIYKDMRMDVVDVFSVSLKDIGDDNGVYLLTLKSDNDIYTERIVLRKE